MAEQGRVFERLIRLCRERNLRVQFFPFQAYNGRVCGDKIGIANDLDIESINYTLAHEIAHVYLHFDKGNILQNDGNYEEQADRAAFMLLDMAKVSGREGRSNADA